MDDFYLDGGKYFIPKNMNVVVDVLSIHYDNVLWGPVDTEIFYPLRFAQERNPASWLAFGSFFFQNTYRNSFDEVTQPYSNKLDRTKTIPDRTHIILDRTNSIADRPHTEFKLIRPNQIHNEFLSISN